MRPLAVLNAIVFGSAVAITFGLGGVLVDLPDPQGQPSRNGRGVPGAAAQRRCCLPGLAAVSGASLFAMLKGLRWRWLAQVAMWLLVAGMAIFYVRA